MIGGGTQGAVFLGSAGVLRVVEGRLCSCLGLSVRFEDKKGGAGVMMIFAPHLIEEFELCREGV